MRKFLKNQKGVTMMEVLVTVALLAIVVVPCLSSFVMAQKGNVLAAQTYNKYTAAQNLMEELKACDSIEDVTSRLSNEYKIGEDKVNESDDIHVVYKLINNSYFEIVVYAGEEFNQDITSGGSFCDSCKLILRGVVIITP